MENLIIDDIHTVRLLKQSGCKQKKVIFNYSTLLLVVLYAMNVHKHSIWFKFCHVNAEYLTQNNDTLCLASRQS